MRGMRNVTLLGLMALALSACTVSVNTNSGLSGSRSNLISSFAPDRGEASSYRVGDQVSFRFSSRSDGYLTLISLNPAGNGSVLIRGAAVRAGTTTFPRAQDRVTYDVAPPLGLQRVRAIFTRLRPTVDVVLQGNYSSDRWNSVTTTYLTPYAPAERDVQETFFYIR